MNIAFIVKGDEKKGMGHVFRCIAIAEHLKISLNKIKIKFFIKDKFPKSILNEKEYETIYIKNISEFILRSDTFIPDIIIFDIQNIEENEFIPIREKYSNAKILCFDNLLSSRKLVDICVDANVSKEENLKLPYSKNVKYLLGPKYIVFREKIHDIEKKEIVMKPKNIVVSVGFTDVNKRIIEIFKSLKNINIKVNVVVGNIENKYKKELVKYGKENFNGNFKLFEDPDNFYEIISNADIAFASGGITLYELAYYGIPTIIYCQVDHQLKIADRFHNKCSVISLGSKTTTSELKDIFIRLCIDHNLRKIMNDNLTTMVDGKGLQRITKLLLK